SRLISFRIVVFPAPLRPTRANTTPASIASEKRSSTVRPPGRANDTSRNSIAGSGTWLATVAPEARDAQTVETGRSKRDDVESGGEQRAGRGVARGGWSQR